MRISRNTEYTIIAVIIAYIAFFPRMEAVSRFVSTPIGKALSLIGIVYVWKFVSPIIAILLVIAYIRCSKGSPFIENLEMPEAECTCPSGYNYNKVSKSCINGNGDKIDPLTCTCSSGYSFDNQSKTCKQSSVMSEPIPPVVAQPPPMVQPTATATTAAPAVTQTTGPVSTAPMTTPGEAQTMATSKPPAVTQEPTIAGTESFSVYGGYPLSY